MASRLIFTITAVAVLSVCCHGSTLRPSHKMEDLKEAEQLHWNKTITKMVNSTSRLADKVETVLNRTADSVFTAANMIGGAASGLTAKVGEKLLEGSNKWAELKNKSAEKMATTRANIEAAKKQIRDKLAAGVGTLVEKGNQLVNLVVGVVGKVVGNVQEAKSKVREQKSGNNARISIVPLSSKLSTLSARIITPVQPVPTPVAEVVAKQENTTTQTSAPQLMYTY